jgi:hypothetical protein
MTGSEKIKPHREGFFEEKAKLYLPVTGDAGVRCPASQVFQAKIIDYILLKLLLHILDTKEWDAQLPADFTDIFDFRGIFGFLADSAA